MTILFACLASFAADLICGAAYALRQVRQREAKADELHFLLAPVIPHSPEETVRRAGL